MRRTTEEGAGRSAVGADRESAEDRQRTAIIADGDADRKQRWPIRPVIEVVTGHVVDAEREPIPNVVVRPMAEHFPPELSSCDAGVRVLVTAETTRTEAADLLWQIADHLSRCSQADWSSLAERALDVEAAR